jgi:methyltransferase (TIGR00027 family)
MDVSDTTELLDAIARTSLLTAALRAVETDRPDRLYADPHARALALGAGFDLLSELESASASRPSPYPADVTRQFNAVRTRFFDDHLLAVTADPGVRQVVLLGAGMDSRASRLDWPEGLDLYEIDRPAVLAAKQRVLDAIEAPPRCARHTVPAALDAGWEDGLLAAGYLPDRRSIWLLEGILYYLTEEHAHRTLESVRRLTTSASVVSGDVVNGAFLRSPMTEGMLRIYADWGCPWVYGVDVPEATWREHGMEAVALQPGEPGAGYGRWTVPVAPREVPDVPRAFLVRGTRV